MSRTNKMIRHTNHIIVVQDKTKNQGCTFVRQLLLLLSTIMIMTMISTVGSSLSSNTISRKQSDDIIQRHLQQQEWNNTSTSSDNDDDDDSDDEIDYRSVLIVRILEESESSDTSSMHHTQLNTILFDGNTTYMTTSTPNGIHINTTGTSVAQQFASCSMGKIQLIPLSSHTNGYIWDIVIDDASSMITDRTERSQWISAAASTAYNLGFLATTTTADNNDDTDRTPQLRSMAQHVIMILPPNYPNEDNSFLASAEVNHSISVFAPTLTSSLSMYMHELGHNIFLQHAGGLNPEQVYGDRTGYMGTSDGSSHFPHKCYNAAQHWQLNWYTPYRVSVLPQFYKNGNQWSGRIQINAFVDATKLTKDDNHVVLVQIDSNTYLQFNRAKMYNIGTPMMIDEVVIIRELTANTQLLKGMNMTNYHDTATYQYESIVTNPNTNRTIKTDVMIQLCDIIIHNPKAGLDDDYEIDYAIVAIGINGHDEDTLCQSNFVTGTTYNGSGIPIYLTNSTKGGPKIDLDDILTNIYELNVLLLILIGCTIVVLIGWTMKLLFLCMVRYCCCGCQCIGGCGGGGDGSKTSTANENSSMTEESPSVTPPSLPVIVGRQQSIPETLPKEQQVSRRQRRWWSRLLPPQRRITQHGQQQQQQRDDTESTETTASQISALPVATIVQIY